ncbi:MAG TPA: PAS domain-containing protein, partial [Spirillospora sp.]|nr:PAS domain-containing protein [Spirillospora sp.]
MTPDRLVPPTIRRWFASPEFIDEDEARTASLLMTILRIVSAALVLYGLLALLSGYLPGLIAVSAGTVIVLLVVALVRRGHAHTAVLMYACTSWALLTASTFAFGGRHGTPFVVLLLMTLVTSILLKNGARLLVIALTFGSSVVIFAAESAGSLPTGLYPPLSLSLFDAAARVVTFLMAALLLHLIAHSLNDALQRVRSSEQAVRAMYADLVSTTISQTYLDSILRSINDALIVLGPDMRIERVNRATLDLLGFTEAELIGQTPEPIFTPDALDWLMRTIQDSPARTIQTTFFTHDGQEIPVSFSASPFFDQRGATQGVGVVCVAQDMAERQQAARELAQREKLYRTLARSLPDMGVLLFDHDLRFMVAEGQALLAAGYVAEQMEGRILTDIMDAERVERLEPFYRQALAGEHVSFEWPNDDRTYFVQALPVRNETGDIFAGMLLIQDITRIKATEHELKQHIEQLTILRRVHDEVNRRLDVSYVLRLALDMAVRISLARAGAVLLLNDDQTIAVAEVIGSFSDNLLDGYPRPPDGVLAQALQSGHAHNLSPPVAIPLISNQRPIGVLLLETAAPLT